MHGAGISGEATPRIHPLSSAHAHAACKSCTANVAVRIIDEACKEKSSGKTGEVLWRVGGPQHKEHESKSALRGCRY